MGFYVDTNGDSDTGRVRRPARPANPNQNPGDLRGGVTLSTVRQAGNVAMPATFAGQTTARHNFMCGGLKITLNHEADPAANFARTAVLRMAQAPLINGMPVADGVQLVRNDRPTVLKMAQPMPIGQSTTLEPGNGTVDGGAAAEFYSVSVQFLTPAELAKELR